jgi:hypothetical protein
MELIGGKGRGQVCKELRRLLIWRGVPIPLVISLPTSSIKPFDSYCSSLQVAGKSFNSVVSTLKLIAKEVAGNRYSEASFSYKENMSDEQMALLMETVINPDGLEMPLAKAMINQFNGIEVTAEDYIGGEATTTDKDGF